MKNFNLEVDTYIANAAEFARPMLQKIRKLFHKACPQIQESMKWNCPHFEYKGLIGGMAAFKKHVGLGFRKSKLMKDPHNLFGVDPKGSMCSAKFADVAEMPADRVLLAYIKEAVALNEQGVKVPKSEKSPARKEVEMPEYFLDALQKNPQALETFEGFSPSHKREYIEWITEAKREVTRQKRIATALEWLAEGKPRNRKYMKRLEFH